MRSDGDLVTENSDGDARVVRLMRDERGEGFERYAQRNRGVSERHLPDRILATEHCRVQARQAGNVLRAEAGGALVRRLQRCLQH